ncbi:uncharacterized protein [Dysidea avara]|uniref:uncharacterized protein n=1 Tax=Dysidea avara TaxID=196820 RepID=UPI00332C46D4
MLSKERLLKFGLLLCSSCMLFYYVNHFNALTRFALRYTANLEHDEDTLSSSSHSKIMNDINSNSENDVLVSESRGFVFSVHIIEQQVGAAMNLLTLSQWAKHVGISTVEPFVNKSVFSWPLRWSQSELSTTLHFHDYFNLDYWNSMCSRFNASPLVSWETFLNRKTDSSIIVLLLFTEHCIQKLVFVDDEINRESDCRSHFNNFEKANGYNIHQVLQTNIVRRVCIPMCKRTFHIDTISKYIYGTFKPKETTVLFIRWIGIMRKYRLRIFEKEYGRTTQAVEMLQTSERIIRDSKNYVKRYLNSEFGDYVAISFRSCKRAKLIDPSEQPQFFKKCIKKLGHTLNSFKSRKLFLALDFGRFGDSKISTYIADDLVKMMEHDLFQVVFNGTLTMEQWEQSFIDITNGITDSGYIAGLHSNILQNSGCLVMFGGSSNFQRNIVYQYKQKHTDESVCIKKICYID